MTNRNGSGASGSKSNISFMKGLFFSFIVMVLFFGTLEVVARVMDAKHNYRYKLLQAISSIEPNVKPVSYRNMKLPWPEQALYVRTFDKGVQDKPYTLGGRTIKNAFEKQKQHFILPRSVAPDRKKIFIVGGSAAFGFPYRYEDTFTHLLEKRLGRGYQVINASQVGWLSGEIAPIAKRIVDFYSPYMLIIFAGNNEWVHWVPKNQPWVSRNLIDAYKALSNSRIFSTILYLGFKRASERQEQLRKKSNEFRIHEEIDGYGYALKNRAEEYFSFNAEEWMGTKEDFLQTFGENIGSMARYAKKRNVRVVLMNVPFNHKLSPVWKHPQPTAFNPGNYDNMDAVISDAVNLLDKGLYEKAVTILDEAISQEGNVPVIHYLKGYALEQMQKWARAEESYGLSREMMIGNLGSRLSINETIRKTVVETGAELADVVGAFGAYGKATGSYFNKGLIDDDCHPNVEGHKVITATLSALILSKP